VKITCDSDALSNFGRRHGRGAREVYDAIASGFLHLNVITVFETRGGMAADRAVADFDRRFGHLPVLTLDRASAIRAGDLWRVLRRSGRTVAPRDLLLAAIADVSRTRLITGDSDFEPLVELGLDIQIASKPSSID